MTPRRVVGAASGGPGTTTFSSCRCVYTGAPQNIKYNIFYTFCNNIIILYYCPVGFFFFFLLLSLLLLLSSLFSSLSSRARSRTTANNAPCHHRTTQINTITYGRCVNRYIWTLKHTRTYASVTARRRCLVARPSSLGPFVFYAKLRFTTRLPYTILRTRWQTRDPVMSEILLSVRRKKVGQPRLWVTLSVAAVVRWW